MNTDNVKRVSSRITEYVRVNWGAPFIVGFMVLLMGSAALLIAGSELLAYELTNFAYYALAVGVVLQFICFLKYAKRGIV